MIENGARPPRGLSCSRLGNNDARRIRFARRIFDEGAIFVSWPRTEVIASRLRARVMHRLHIYDRRGDANLPPYTRALRRWSYMAVSSSFLTDYARIPQLSGDLLFASALELKLSGRRTLNHFRRLRAKPNSNRDSPF